MANLPDLFRNDRSLFGDAFRDMDEFINRMWMAPLAANRSMRGMLSQPRMDIDETNDAYLLSFEVPGFKNDEINLNVQDNVLTVSAEHKEEAGEENRRSRRFESFTRSLTLPAGIDAGQIEAHCENGLLEIFVPKAEEQKPKSIQIQSGAGGFAQRLKGAQAQSVQGQKVSAKANQQAGQQANQATSQKTETQARH